MGYAVSSQILVSMRNYCDASVGSGFVRNGYFINGRYYSRPAFMEGVPPPYDGVRLAGGIVGGGGAGGGGAGGGGAGSGGAGGGAVIRRRSSSFQDNVGYIGYLTTNDDVANTSSVEDIVNRRRRELLNTDGAISFSECLLVHLILVALVVLFVLAVQGFRLMTRGMILP
jgi:hypothetical protein